MRLAHSLMIRDIDEYAERELGIVPFELIKRSGEAVARAVRELVCPKTEVLILAGKGNNGADGYAAACELISDYSVTVCDVFSSGQRSDGGKEHLKRYLSLGGRVVDGVDYLLLERADCIVDAIFGTGFSGCLTESLSHLAKAINRSGAKKVALDIPLGVNADDGSIEENAVSVDFTVALSYVKPGLLSYPAKALVGRIICDSLGLPEKQISERFVFKSFATDGEWAKSILPKRVKDGNKGTFGKVLLITGSEEYRGAAHLSAEGALRGGAGLVAFAGDAALSEELRLKFPELIFHPYENAVKLSGDYRATLVGSGSGCSEKTASTVRKLLSSDGGALVLDADAINSICKFGGTELIKTSPRSVILTPHPLEFSRLTGKSVLDIGAHRIEYAKRYASENGCIILLKGAGSVITDGDELYINTSGSVALAKAGSGDVLAGLLTSLLGFIEPSASTVALAAYIHGLAGDKLSRRFSSYGVTPSDLPKECAGVISELECQN